MVLPPLTTDLQLSSGLEPFPRSISSTPNIHRAAISSVGDQKRNDDQALSITTIENSVTCGWYAGAVSQPFICSEPFFCATNTDDIIACTKKNEKGSFYSICLNIYNGSPRDCAISGVLCCNSANPSCMTLVWTASPTRSLVQCAEMESTWLMQDYPYELGQSTTTSIESDTSTSSSSSHRTMSPSDTSQPSTISGVPSSDSSTLKPSSSSTSISSDGSSESTTAAPSLGSSFSTLPVTIPAPSNTASPLPVNHTLSQGLSTGAKVGIGVGAGAGVLIALALIGLFFIKRHKSGATTQFEEPPSQNTTPSGVGLRENPNGDLPAEIAPPARAARSLATAWPTGASINDEFDLLEGASEVPVDMRGQGVGAMELEGSPVELSTIGEIAQGQYEEYQTQASQYHRYSQMSRDPRGTVSYQGPEHEDATWSGSSI